MIPMSYPAFPSGHGHATPRRRCACGPVGGLLGLLSMMAGCGHPPPAVLSNSVLGDEEEGAWRVLSPSAQSQTLKAMRSMASGQRPVNPPAPAPGGLRFSDVKAAVDEACTAIEAVVVRTYEDSQGRWCRFELRTVQDAPGELVVRRVDGPAVYEAQAWIGRFAAEPGNLKRADALVKALAGQMKRLGKQKWFNEKPPSPSPAAPLRADRNRRQAESSSGHTRGNDRERRWR